MQSKNRCMESPRSAAAPADLRSDGSGQTTPAAVSALAPVDASAAAPKTGDASFFEKHEKFLARAKSGPIGVLFLGDSITEGLAEVPHVWESNFGKFRPANFGISGDQTQHLIWRIDHGELDGIHPKVVVLLIGTNNAGAHTAAQIVAAKTKIVRLMREKLPGAKVLLLAIFPRGRHPNRDGTVDSGVERMAVINAVNVELAKFEDGKNVRFLNLNACFLEPGGTISTRLMPDQLHLSAAGYKLWAEAMRPLLTELMG